MSVCVFPLAVWPVATHPHSAMRPRGCVRAQCWFLGAPRHGSKRAHFGEGRTIGEEGAIVSLKPPLDNGVADLSVHGLGAALGVEDIVEAVRGHDAPSGRIQLQDGLAGVGREGIRVAAVIRTRCVRHACQVNQRSRFALTAASRTLLPPSPTMQGKKSNLGALLCNKSGRLVWIVQRSKTNAHPQLLRCCGAFWLCSRTSTSNAWTGNRRAPPPRRHRRKAGCPRQTLCPRSLELPLVHGVRLWAFWGRSWRGALSRPVGGCDYGTYQ